MKITYIGRSSGQRFGNPDGKWESARIDKVHALGGLRTGSVQLTMTMKGYTGQYRDSYINLVWMNSRWYDPELGRWTQPGSIIPDPINPADSDRFSYVRNNSINYIDPSGHDPQCILAVDDQCVRMSDGKIIDIKDVSLSTIPGKGGKTGEDIYVLYLEYTRVNGWWNDFGKAAFGLTELLGMWILFEGTAGLVDTWLAQAAKIAVAIAQNLFVGSWNPAMCGVGICYNAVFNFIAKHIDGGSGLLSGPNSASVKNEIIYSPRLLTSGKEPITAWDLIHQ